MKRIHRSQNWKHSRGDKQSNRLRVIFSPKRILAVLLLFAIPLALFLVFRFIREQISELRQLTFSKEIESTFPIELDTKLYSSDSIYTLLLVSEEVENNRTVTQGFVLLRLDMTSHRADVITLHPELSVPLQYIPVLPADSLNLTSSKVKDLRVIGELQTKPIPFPYLFYQLQELYAIQIDGYVMFPSDIVDQVGVFSGLDRPDTTVDGLKGYSQWSKEWAGYWTEYVRSLSIFQIWMHRDLVPNIESNMGVDDVYAFSRDFSSLPEDSIVTHILANNQVEKNIDDRGEQISGVSISAIESLLADLGADERMDREQARIEIFNGTEISGWGSRYERWVRHLGGDVIRVKNAPQQGEGTTIYATDLKKYEYSLERITTLWDTVTIVEGRPDFITTGDIIIVLGVDF